MQASLVEFADRAPWVFRAVAFATGACLGSFLNVVILRLPAGKSIVRPGSRCACGTPIAWRDNIPILSWLILRGRARCCGRPFSVRYLVVELLTALAFLACSLLFPPAPAVCGCVFLAGLIGAAFIDLDHMVIPDTFTLGLGVAGVMLSFAVPALHGEAGGYFALDSLRSGAAGLGGLLLGSGLVLWIALLGEAVLKKEAMGLGDVKFAGAIGAFCGWRGAVFALFGGAVIGTAWFGLALVWRRSRGQAARVNGINAGSPTPSLGIGARVPFGPMLAAGGAVYFLALRGPVDAWFASFTGLF
jgi:leader peptidase (prepilin peptidase) / N-methyltransferase